MKEEVNIMGQISIGIKESLGFNILIDSQSWI